MKIINYLKTKIREIVIENKNCFFNRLLIEERVRGLLIELAQIQKPLAYDIQAILNIIYGEIIIPMNQKVVIEQKNF